MTTASKEEKSFAKQIFSVGKGNIPPIHLLEIWEKSTQLWISVFDYAAESRSLTRTRGRNRKMGNRFLWQWDTKVLLQRFVFSICITEQLCVLREPCSKTQNIIVHSSACRAIAVHQCKQQTTVTACTFWECNDFMDHCFEVVMDCCFDFLHLAKSDISK